MPTRRFNPPAFHAVFYAPFVGWSRWAAIYGSAPSIFFHLPEYAMKNAKK